MLLMSCTREDKAQRTNPPYRPYSRSRLIGSCPIDSHRNPAKVILERTGFPAYNISLRVAWTFRGGENCKTFRECGSCDECETKENKEGLFRLNAK